MELGRYNGMRWEEVGKMRIEQAKKRILHRGPLIASGGGRNKVRICEGDKKHIRSTEETAPA